eukprot:2854412-Amphidinium_carterae.1
MASILFEYLDQVRSPCVTLGDFNVLTDPGDVLTFAGAQKPLTPNADARWWSRRMQRFYCATAPWTFRHKA